MGDFLHRALQHVSGLIAGPAVEKPEDDRIERMVGFFPGLTREKIDQFPVCGFLFLCPRIIFPYSLIRDESKQQLNHPDAMSGNAGN